MREFATQIATRMRTRRGKHIYQFAGFSLAHFPKELAMQIFAGLEETESTASGTSTWTASTSSQTAALFTSLFAELDASCAGASRAIRKPSETVAHVIATVMPGAEFSHVARASGPVRLYANFQYTLADGAGELHPPKDPNRIEVVLSAAEEQTIRQQILADAGKIAQAGVRLAPGWWRQLGMEDKALEAEALLTNSAAQPAPAAKSKKRKARSDVFEVEAVLEEDHGWVRLRWAGYQPSWEPWRISGNPGTPIETWEKLTPAMKKTEAWQSWVAT